MGWVIALVLALAACGGERGGRANVERRDSSGVEVVVSSGVDMELNATYTPQFTLGGEEEGPGSFFQVNETLVGTDDAGRIHVLDREAYRVSVFDGDGRPLWSAGQQGEGPGELGRPWALAVAPDGESLVVDFADVALEGFRDGEATGGRSLPFRFFGGGVAVQGHDLLAFTGGATDATQAVVRVRPGGDTTVVRSRQGSPLKPLDLRESCGISISGMSPQFEPLMAWNVRGGRLALAVDGTYRVEVYDGERLIRMLERALSPRPADRATALAQLGEGMRIRTPNGELVCRPEEVLEQTGFLPVIPWIASVRVASDGALWVRRFAVGADATGPIDLFDPSGAYRGTFPADTRLPLAFLPDGRVLLQEVDEVTGVERLVVARVEIRESEG
jgi:hypothetical protein